LSDGRRRGGRGHLVDGEQRIRGFGHGCFSVAREHFVGIVAFKGADVSRDEFDVRTNFAADKIPPASEHREATKEPETPASI